MDEVCVIGGNRYFGRRVVELLRDGGAKVTVLNRGSATPPPGVAHVVADRDDEAGLLAALGGRSFDVVLDQVLYRPEQAEIALRVFGGRAGRYLMTSTVEVYDQVHGVPGRPLGEAEFDAAAWAGAPSDEYAEGKRGAEAVLARQSALPYAAVRTAHVLGGGDADFTGRLAHYVGRMRSGAEIVAHRPSRPATFVEYGEIADFLVWAAGSDVTGPVNAASHGELDVRELCALIAAQGVPEARFTEAGEPSPFSFGHYYGVDNARAEQLGYRFSRLADWLPKVIEEQVRA
ncbi:MULTISPECIES: reductase [unclassified Kitasatospora]|uniref:reductase n=1 Tax=unclassified Kitasatospora TaxID=2633591 RepID=UPI000710C35C|nr:MULTISPECIES: reductase [unclassified Kitasatospora]KQV18620.1 reductase [Kitasatospora sp. Root107]KRB74602.1 reductase [Kitasatospora sp. Root187]